MAETKKEKPARGIEEVDAWTSNGYGLIINGKPIKPITEADDDIDEVEEA